MEMLIFGVGVPCGGLGTYVGDVNIGKGFPWGLEVGPWGDGGFGESYGGCLYHKGWGVLRQTLDMLIL